jgi:ERF superfamily
MASAASGGIYAALLAVQKAAPALQKNAINPHFGNKYVSLDSLMPQILPLLNENGLVLMQPPTHFEGAPALTTIITHPASGESVEFTMPLILDKQNSQGQGSAITYARRYALLSILGLVADVDDDGAKASTSTRTASATRGGGGEDW